MAKKKEISPVKIRKLRTNYELRFDYLPILATYIKTLPKEHRAVRIDNVLDVNGGTRDEWVRIIREVQMGNIISFLVDNSIPFVFENLLPEELNQLRRDYLERQRRISEVLKAKESALDFKDMDFSFTKTEPYDYQKQAVVFFEINDGKAILGDQPGVGKANPIDTLIATKSGWTMMGDLKIGQHILHHNGSFYPVTGIYPQGEQETYRVVFNDGFSVECNMEHLWVVRDVNRRKRGKGWVVKNLQELCDSGLSYNHSGKRTKSGRKPVLKWEIPMVQPAQYSKSDFIVDPYVIGALIGDGYICGETVEISIPDAQLQIKETVESRLPDGFKLYEDRTPSCPQYRITRNHSVGNNIVKSEIRSLGLNVKSGHKFIPQKYLISSIEQRIELLRGLMDTDGSAKKNRINYHTTSKRLAYDVAELVQSLGGQAIVNHYNRSHKGKSNEWRVNIRINICPFHLDEKKKEWWVAKRNYASRYIKEVIPTEKKEHQCISVDSPDHTYVTEHYIVTHNTLPPIVYAAKHQLKTLVICPASLKLNWRKEVLNFTHEKAHVFKYNPNKKSKKINYSKEESLIHIINYESIQSYIKLEYKHVCGGNMIVPGEKPRKCGTEIVDLNKKHIKCEHCKNKNSFKSRVTGLVYIEDKDGSVLDPEDYDLIVIDEFHRIKSTKTDWTQIIRRAFRDTIPRRILISGTAIKSRPMEFFSGLNFMDPEMWNSMHDFGVRYCAAYESNFGWNYDGASNLEELFTRISPYFLRRLKKDVLSQLPDKTYTEIEIELTPTERKEYEKLVKEVKKVVGDNGTEEQKQESYLEKIHKLKQFTGMVKLDRMISDGVVDSIASNGEKLVVMSDYQILAEKLHSEYGDKSVIHTGSMSLEDKQTSVDRFQEDKTVNLFCGMIGASGVGITLTEASKLIFLGFAWTPGDMMQAEDRIHRATTTHDNIQIITYVCVDTIDEDIRDLLNRKEDVVSKVLDGKATKRDITSADSSILKELISNLKSY